MMDTRNMIGTTHGLSRLALVAASVVMVGLAVVLAIGWASPAAAFIDEARSEATVQDEPAAGEPAEDHGVTEVEQAQPAPTGGVDAGFGGTAADAGFGPAHAVAAGLLALIGALHASRVRRLATVDV